MYTNLQFRSRLLCCSRHNLLQIVELFVAPVCGQVKPLIERRKFDLMCQDCSTGIDKYLETEEFMEKLVPVLPLEG